MDSPSGILLESTYSCHVTLNDTTEIFMDSHQTFDSVTQQDSMYTVTTLVPAQN